MIEIDQLHILWVWQFHNFFTQNNDFQISHKLFEVFLNYLVYLCSLFDLLSYKN